MVLGKGLASLLPSSPPPSGASFSPSSAPSTQSDPMGRIPGISMANVEDIGANTFQPRRDFDDSALEELAQSIRANGIIQPLVVRRGTNGKYELIAGERRLRASKLAGLKQVPIVIRKSTDRESLELALIENIQRQNLNCIDEALAYFQLMQEFSLTQEEMAVRVGKDRATVSNYIRLLKLPEPIIDDLKKSALSFGHGKALLSVDDMDIRLRARAEIIEKRLSVRDTEELVANLKRQAQGGPEAPPAQNAAQQKTPIQNRLFQLSQDVTRHISAKVEIKGNEKRGKIVIHYGNRQELERLLGIVQK